MSKDETPPRTPIPVLRKATADIERAARNEMEFTANSFQERVKARFYRRLEELSHIMDKEAVFKSEDQVIQLAGTSRITRWLEDPAFASWFVDEEYIVDTISSLQAKSLEVVAGILANPSASEGDRLKAAKMLLELGDMFPGRKSEVKFLDDRVNSLSESETDKEIKKLQGVLYDHKDT